ncbi:hypothetical protein [Parerythrobacter aestuarii]|uniref:hypothetical protein n=1 Tax=Parerythrobacter aestuarii TaxID=3020909 RepID=UPI0024DE15CF|nr:hypothetical protein [Parerythrobacter aestuarii]
MVGAKEPGDPGYETEWMVTTKVPDVLAAPRTLGKNEIVFQQRIVFERLAEADVALVQADNGEEFIPAGEQYYKALTAPEHELWCTANMKMPEGDFAKTVIGRVYSQYCIYDHDKDGTFDAFFKRARTIPVAPTVRGKVRAFEKMRTIKPLKLTDVAPETLRTEYFWGVAFLKNGRRGPQFTRFAGSEFGMFALEKEFRGEPGQNQIVSDEDFTITYSTKEKQIEVHGFTPMAEKSIRIHGTQCGMINGC